LLGEVRAAKTRRRWKRDEWAKDFLVEKRLGRDAREGGRFFLRWRLFRPQMNQMKKQEGEGELMPMFEQRTLQENAVASGRPMNVTSACFDERAMKVALRCWNTRNS
jgi:hypothetical protein